MSYGDYPSVGLRAGVEQLTYLLFLKMADERTKPPCNQPSPVPEKYRWPSLLIIVEHVEGQALQSHIDRAAGRGRKGVQFEDRNRSWLPRASRVGASAGLT